jgi:hypothetical protein
LLNTVKSSAYKSLRTAKLASLADSLSLKWKLTKKKKHPSQHLTVLSGWVVTFALTKLNPARNVPLVAVAAAVVIVAVAVAVETVAVVAAVAVAADGAVAAVAVATLTSLPERL